MNNDKQTINSENNYDKNTTIRTEKKNKSYEEKYDLQEDVTNRYSSWITNPSVQPDAKTEMGVPIPDKLNTEFSKEYQEENKL